MSPADSIQSSMMKSRMLNRIRKESNFQIRPMMEVVKSEVHTMSPSSGDNITQVKSITRVQSGANLP